MRIPLDYYRILGLSPQATPEQIQQAYDDRLQQLPRFQYSPTAIERRKELLTRAYGILSDPQQRQDYDEKLANTTYPPEQTIEGAIADIEPTGIEIQSHQLTGALLLLQELSEYDMVLKLGQTHLTQGELNLKPGSPGSALFEADVVLAIALASLESGRELWQQGQYEKAAQALQSGQDLLRRENLFNDLQQELQTDLYRLRPYRILELLALPVEQQTERDRGLALLKEMLQERGGIDGTGNDYSGLSINDFLLFIQQIRSYLSVSEQQEIFEAEAQRSSAVAMYLAAYTLIARGFGYKQPALIRRAKAMLLRLSMHQDVYLEQAICALLLGQIEEANQILELSQEQESLAFIRQYSVDSPDSIPGLYLYTEQWLQTEVYPYYQDLASETVSLKEYFADEQIQAYLDHLVVETQDSRLTAAKTQPPLVTAEPRDRPATAAIADSPESAAAATAQSSSASEAANWTLSQSPPPLSAPLNQEPEAWEETSSVTDNHHPLPLTPDSEQQLSQFLHPPQDHNGTHAANLAERGRPLQSMVSTPEPLSRKGKKRSRKSAPASRTQRQQARLATQRRRQLTLIGVGVLSLGLIAAVVHALMRTSQDSPQPVVISPVPTAQDELLIDLARPPIPIPGANLSTAPVADNSAIAPSVTANARGTLTSTIAKETIQSWQTIKAEAMGKNYRTEKLADILAEPALSRWRSSVQASKAESSYWEYTLNNLAIEKINAQSSTQAKVSATVNETAKLYAQNQLQSDSSYTDTYPVEYTLVQTDGRWRIKEMQVR